MTVSFCVCGVFACGTLQFCNAGVCGYWSRHLPGDLWWVAGERNNSVFSPFFLLQTICELQLGGFKFHATLRQHCWPAFVFPLFSPPTFRLSLLWQQKHRWHDLLGVKQTSAFAIFILLLLWTADHSSQHLWTMSVVIPMKSTAGKLWSRSPPGWLFKRDCVERLALRGICRNFWFCKL